MKTPLPSGPQAVNRIVLALASAGLASLPQLVQANPVGGQVVAGTATIAQETPSKVAINQTSGKAIVDWRSFSIGANEQVQFRQPSASAVTLNRVVGEDPSKILGRLSANGQVFLVNPNGIYFGRNSQIDVAGLVASTHNIRNEDFMAGKYVFNLPGKPNASVINEGTIRIADTGIAAFVAPSVANRGVIVAKLGKVALAAANGFTLDFTGDKLLTFLVSDEVAKTAFDIEGKQLTSFVENSGKIEAQGGYVLLTAKAAENAIHGVINQSGVIEATTVGTHNGEIILNAGKGSLSVSGNLDASAPNGGDGGFIETSGGKVSLDPATRISTVAPFGKTGRWLIDPTDYVIGTGGDITSSALVNYLNSTDVEIQTAATGVENGNIYVNSDVSWGSANKLTLTAYRDIYVNAAINANGGGSVKLRSDSTGTGTGTVVFGNYGHITVNGGAAVGVYYNPALYSDAATKSDANGNPYASYVTLNGGSSLTAFMLVRDVNQLQSMNSNLSGRYALSKDIDAGATSSWNSGAGFSPVGTDPAYFTGVLNGLGKTISGLYINRQNADYVGLFGISWGKLSNINIVATTILGGSNVGGLIGYNYAGGIIDNCHVEAHVSGKQSVGGLVGANYLTSVIKNSSANAVISSTTEYDYVGFGGLVGNSAGTVDSCYSSGVVSGRNSVGGLIGGAQGDRSTIRNSYSTASVSGVALVGGLLGRIESDSSIINCYATGTVSAIGGKYSFPYKGGLVGYAFTENAVVTASYWDQESSGQQTSAGGRGYSSGEMKHQASFSGWDFTNTWTIHEGISYPTLRQVATSSLTLQPGVVYSASTLHLFNRYRTADATTLLNGIFSGDLRNDPTNPVWHALYQNGTATVEQVEANRLWNVWDRYKSADSAALFDAIVTGSMTNQSGDAVWAALTQTSAKSQASTWVDTYNSYKTKTAPELFSAIVKRDLINAIIDPVWSRMYLSGAETAAQTEANRLFSRYQSYGATSNADLAKLFAANQFTGNDVPVWNALLAQRGAALSQALVDAVPDCQRTNSCGIPVGSGGSSGTSLESGAADTSGSANSGGVIAIPGCQQTNSCAAPIGSGSNPGSSSESGAANTSGSGSGGGAIPGGVISGNRDVQSFFNSADIGVATGNITLLPGRTIELAGHVFDTMSLIEYLLVGNYNDAGKQTVKIIAAKLIPLFGQLSTAADTGEWLAKQLDTMLTNQSYGAFVDLLNNSNPANGQKPSFTWLEAQEFFRSGPQVYGSGGFALGEIRDMVTAGYFETSGFGSDVTYTLSFKGALAIYGSLVPPKKDGAFGMYGKPTYEGVAHDYELLSQLQRAIAPAN